MTSLFSGITWWLPLGVVLTALPAQTASGLLPSQARPIEQLARDLQRAGKQSMATEVVDLLSKLSYPARDLQGLKDSLLRQGRDEKFKPEQALRSLDEAVKTLLKLAEKATGPFQQDIARQVLRLDGNNAAAHALLQHQNIGSRWLTPEEVSGLQRRNAWLGALQQARDLELKVTTSDCSEPFLVQVLGRGGSAAKFGGYELRSGLTPTHNQRILETAARIAALSNWCMSGKLAVPNAPTEVHYVMANRTQGTNAIDKGASLGWWPKEERDKDFELIAYVRPNSSGDIVELVSSEDQLIYSIAERMCSRHLPQSLQYGLVRWNAQALAGLIQTSSIETTEKSERDEDEDETKDDSDEEMGFLREGSWLARCQHLAGMVQRGQAPNLAKALKATTRSARLNKAAALCAWLFEQNLLNKLSVLPKNTAPTVDSFCKALDAKPEDIEQRLHAWIAQSDQSMRAKLSNTGKPAVANEHRELLEQINKYRRLAISDIKGLPRRWTLTADEALTLGAKTHAQFLNGHKDLQNWPAVSRVQADLGESTDGAWAALHSITLLSVKSTKAALDSAMAGVDGRVALLDPGTLRIGIAQAGDVLVLDTGSIKYLPQGGWASPWPFENMKSVPVAMQPQLRPPVPGVDQATLGYPITLRIGLADDAPLRTVQMKLFEVRATGRLPVECHESSPQQPLDPTYAPARVYFLIPKAPLKANAEFRVEADYVGEKTVFAWTFFTGK